MKQSVTYIRLLSIAILGYALLPSSGAAQIPFGAKVQISGDTDHAWSVHSADLDGDGMADVLSASLFDGKVAWYRNLGAGAFGPQSIIADDTPTATSVYAADFDGDGDLDVLSSASSSQRISWHENDGTGAFGPPRVISTSYQGLRRSIAADMDNDGDPDVVAGAAASDVVVWWRNDGAGNFGSGINIAGSDEATPVRVADFDGDGFLDVVSAGMNTTRVDWYRNDGGTTIGAGGPVGSGAGPFSLFAADLDEDDDPDIVVGYRATGQIVWYRNDGSGSFSQAQVVTTNSPQVHSVISHDLDGDGDEDLAAASVTDDRVEVFENLGGGAFGPSQIISTDVDGAFALWVDDLDNDGDADLIAAASDGDEVVWFENQSVIPDVTAPVATLLGEVPLHVECADPFVDPGATVTDDQDPSPSLVVSGSVDASTPGSYLLTYTATDASGNQSAVDRIVIVEDTTPPAVVAALERVREGRPANHGFRTGRFTVTCTASDNCSSDPDVVSYMALPETDEPTVRFVHRRRGKNQISYNARQNRFVISGQDPEALWDEVSLLGGVAVEDGQHLRLIRNQGRVMRFAFDREGSLIRVSGSADLIALICRATDGTGNQAQEQVGPGETTVVAKATAPALAVSQSESAFDVEALPEAFALAGNYPNPFNPETTIGFELPETAKIMVAVYDMLGRRVSVLVDGARTAGRHEVRFDAGHLPSGAYLTVLQTPEGRFTKQMVLLR